ncbi:MAG TPA: hypothetical protein DCG57_01150 [Candidatus Riflebacteria bacterium]|nr:hypothetical protein [Candidatus Riflebacteria bacterium]
MRLLKRQPGLPFLLALGVLLILSASFLAVQLWSGDTFRGAVEALEAPMMPPSLPVGKKGGAKASSGKKIEQKPVVAVEVVSAPEVQELEAGEPVNAPAPTPAVEAVKASDMVEAPAMPLEVKKPAPAKVKEVTAPAKASVVKPARPVSEVKPVQAEPVGTSVEQALSAPVKEKVSEAPRVAKNLTTSNSSASTGKVSSKKGRAARKAAKEAAKEADENEVPPEWNWFNIPLKLEISGGNVEIVSTGAPKDVALVTVVARLPAGLFVDAVEPVSGQSASESNYEADLMPVPASEKPFVSALAKMAKLRRGRMAAIEADPELEKAAAAHRSNSIEELRLAVVTLRSRLDVGSRSVDPVVPAAVAASDISYDAGSYASAPAPDASGVVVEASITTEVSKEPVAAVIDAGSDDKSEFKFVPYYSGSGSPVSGRINTLLQRGVGYRPR